MKTDYAYIALKSMKTLSFCLMEALKRQKKVQNSPDLLMKFREAQIFAKRIWEAIKNKSIIVDVAAHSLHDAFNNEEIFL